MGFGAPKPAAPAPASAADPFANFAAPAQAVSVPQNVAAAINVAAATRNYSVKPRLGSFFPMILQGIINLFGSWSQNTKLFVRFKVHWLFLTK